MRFPVLALLSLVSITGIFAQGVPVISIAGQPFSAEETTVRVPAANVRNVLPRQTTRIYRDFAGRTRTDTWTPASLIDGSFISIDDPGAGVHYSLDTKNKIARRFLFPAAAPGQTPSTVTLVSSLYCKFGPPCPVTRAESLGTKVIEGLATDGQRSTTVSPAGAPGGGGWTAVVESWYSAELRVILLMKESNSLGTGTTRLENINRAEPDPLLFQVPPDYTIVEEPANQAVLSR